MENFIAKRIMYHGDNSLEEGREYYRKYFRYTKMYRKWEEPVKAILTKNNRTELIVTE